MVFGGRGADGRVFDDVHFLTFRECASSTKVSSVSSHEKRSEKTGGGADESREAAAWTCAWRPSAANRNGANHRGESRFARPRAREGASAAFQPPTASAKRGTAWVFGGCGGEDGETLFDDVWAFDVASETWRPRRRRRRFAVSPKLRFAHACAVVRVDALVDVVANVDGCSKSKTHDSMMVAHGGVGNDAKTLSDLWTFSFRDETWREVSGEILVGFVPKPRAMFAAVLCARACCSWAAYRTRAAACPPTWARRRRWRCAATARLVLFLKLPLTRRSLCRFRESSGKRSVPQRRLHTR